MPEVDPIKIIATIQGHKKTVIDSVKKKLDVSKVEDIIKKALNPKESTKALSNVLLTLNNIEEVIYDISIIKMELRELSEKLPNETQYSMVRKELKVGLSAVGDCYIIAKNRYDHVDRVLTGVRSINSNVRMREKGHDDTK